MSSSVVAVTPRARISSAAPSTMRRRVAMPLGVSRGADAPLVVTDPPQILDLPVHCKRGKVANADRREGGETRATVVKELGGPEQLQLTDRPTPEPGAGEIRVDTTAAGGNFMDPGARPLDAATGEPPFVPGVEGAGRVSALGACVTEFAVGDRSPGCTPTAPTRNRSCCPPPAPCPFGTTASKRPRPPGHRRETGCLQTTAVPRGGPREVIAWTRRRSGV
ncbi:alcohol dehydrogenase catalytic domain-containing protein [Streptomyces antimycoticus]|uniref:alcohol dehydrogenase catalytic domain-containing protein n=1 Tax=Streptomyces antimycoticus TaxID=68175 RepID=UPI0036E4510F